MHYTFAALLAAVTAVSALPTERSGATRHGLPIIETTTLSNGHVIDWVMPGDSVARGPSHSDSDGMESVVPLNGPKGAVPYLRTTHKTPMKSPAPDNVVTDGSKPVVKRDRAPAGHKYAYTSQTVNNSTLR